MIFRFFTCLKYFLDRKSKISQCAKDNKFIWCCISVQVQFEMVVLKVLREFAGGTSIHGFTFLVRPESSSWTKIIWTICLAVALTYATLEMRNSVVGKYDYITSSFWNMGLLELHTLQICSFEFEFEIKWIIHVFLMILP